LGILSFHASDLKTKYAEEERDAMQNVGCEILKRESGLKSFVVSSTAARGGNARIPRNLRKAERHTPLHPLSLAHTLAHRGDC
jgi:hypothetical protein